MTAVEKLTSHLSSSRQLHKFGGSSLADPDCFRRVVTILSQYSESQDIIVVSAAGKTTNHLIEYLHHLTHSQPQAEAALSKLHQFQQGLIDTLFQDEVCASLTQALTADIDQLRQQDGEHLDPAKRAALLGLGEIWSARLLTALLEQSNLPTKMLDSRVFLRAPQESLPEVDQPSSAPLLEKALNQHKNCRWVITGFMAQDLQGQTVLLGRNGSDYSATVIGAMLNVQRVILWSDVAGVYSADPHRISDACLLPLLRLDEAAELARLGAPVLHARTLQPISQSAVELELRSSHAPDAGSTKIERILASGRGAKIVTALDEVSMLQLDVPKSSDFTQAQHEIDALLSARHMMPMAQHVSQDQHRIQLIYTDEMISMVLDCLQNAGFAAEIRLREGFRLVAVVGAGVTENPNHTHGFYQQLRGQPIEFICETETKLSIVAILRKGSAQDLAQQIHCSLFKARRKIGVVLLGKGNIGSRFLGLFHEQKEAFEKRHAMQINLMAVIDSEKHWFASEGLDAGSLMKDFDQHAVNYEGLAWVSLLKDHPFDELVIMDVTASPELATHYAEFAALGFHVITANKFAGSASRDLYEHTKQAFRKTGRAWLYNATVGAGLPVNYAVRDLKNSGDQIIALSGIFSGTLSWLFQHYCGDIAFSERLEQAWQQGLTEPDPREDLSGADVMRKLVILARDAGLDIEPEAVEVQSLVPEALKDLSLDEFFESAELIDEALAPWQKKADKQGGVIRYVARLGRNGKARVGIEIIAQDSPLANLFPCDNFFAIESHWYRDNPLVIKALALGEM